MRSALQWSVFLPLQALGAPLGAVGGAVTGARGLAATRRRGVSFTAAAGIEPRWLLHQLGVRSDPRTVALLRHMPAEAELGRWMMFGPAVLAHRLTGFLPPGVTPSEAGPASLLTRRLHELDRIFAAAVPRVEQVVVLGGGFDLRILELTENQPVRAFEVDQAETQALKLEVMAKAGIAHEWVTYLPVDFRTESWVDTLLADGFDPTRPTYWHWESVSLYLDEAVVRETLRKIGELSATGSILAQDVYGTALTRPRSPLLGAAIHSVAMIGEPVKFGLDLSGDVRAAAEGLLEGSGFTLTEHIPVRASRLRRKPVYAIVVGEKPPSPGTVS
ncbi:MAG: SAM-dependent methyltransferase [Myxococcota bacterium]